MTQAGWLVLGCWLAGALPVAAQPTTLAPATRPVVRRVPPAEVLWQKAIWRVVDLREVANRPWFVPGHEVSSLLLAAVRRGELVAYRSDSLRVPLTSETLTQRLLDPEATVPGTPYQPRQLYQLEVREDLVFDKRHARMTHEWRSVTLMVPAAETAWGIDQVLAAFRYEDLVQWCRAHPAEALWREGVRPLNLAVALEQGLYHAYIRKISNPDDRDLFELVADGDPQRALAESYRVAGQLIEFEDGLWGPR